MGGWALVMGFMDDAIWDALRRGVVTPREAYMKSIDKNRFRNFLASEDEGL